MRASPSRIEVALLGALLFAVPLVEAPKHLLWLAWVIAWAAGRMPRLREAFSGWGVADWIALAFAASALAAGAFGGAWTASIQGAGDPVRLALTLLLASRAGYRPRQWLAVLACALAGTLAALAWAAVELQRAAGPAFLELHSVGHVNHTAIYLAISTALAIGLAVSTWRVARRAALGFAGTALLLGVSLFVSASRAALGATVVFLALFAWAAPLSGASPRARRRLVLAVAAALAGVALVYGAVQHLSPHPLQPAGEGLAEKFESRPEDAGVLAFRDKLWRVAMLAFASNPAFGIGNNQFRTLTPEGLCPGGAGAGAPAGGVLPDPCDTDRLYFAQHAHSVYANTLAERGAFGLAAALALLGLWAVALVRGLRAGRDDGAVAGLWSASLGGFSVTAFAGLLNTTLQHEHGLLAMVLLAALLSVSGRAPPSAAKAAVS